MKTLRIHSLDKGWCDKDAMMLHAAFQLLVDFMDKEEPDQIVDWGADPLHKKAWKDIRSLYRWWTRTRPARRDPLDEKGLKRPPMRWEKVPGSDCKRLREYDKKEYPEYERAFRKHVRLEKKWEDEDQKNFHRLVEVRGFLWT